MKRDILFDYYMTFGEHPPKTVTMGYDNETYQFLMKRALFDTRKPITPKDLDEALKDKIYDIDYSSNKR